MRNRGELERSGLHRDLLDALEAALDAVEPRRLMRRRLRRSGGCVEIQGAGRLCPRAGVYLAGFGKAARGMAEGVVEALDGLVEAGVVVAPRGHGGRVGPVEVLEGDHPVPGEATLRSSRRLLEFLASVPGDALLLVLVSGGGSSLFEVPADGVSLEDEAVVVERLLRRGADIYELNAVRKHLSAVKGGQLLRYTRAGRVVSLIVSDVVGDRLDTVASGPTVPDETSFSDAYRVLRRYGVWEEAPEAVRSWIEAGLRGLAPETPKPGDPLFEKATSLLVASNRDALRAAAGLLRARGYNTVILTDRLRGEAREAAKPLAGVVESTAAGGPSPAAPPAALLAGGETTVTVRGGGTGGRNQELCLSLAMELHRGRSVARYAAACMGTDGVDGNSPAAGALVDEETLPRALSMGLDPWRALEGNDSYGFFSQSGGVIDTGGFTGTNVNDVFIALVPLQPP
ncbi:glycerate kinase [Pyrodictium occultum]|uniref:Glycerate kinase n=1 Tax=Pyrodictium occultum TaxID=2309 RepID=A0A0V8RXG1_PYROC|nr:glycerate kinase [Pyrodictium occultum]